MVEDIVGADAVDALSKTADAATIQLFVDDRLVPEVTAPAAVFLGYVQAQQAGLANELPGFAIDVMLCPPAGIVGQHFGFDEPRDGIAECGQVVIHPIGALWHRQVSFGYRASLPPGG